jgi:hypothetical protein
MQRQKQLPKLKQRKNTLMQRQKQQQKLKQRKNKLMQRQKLLLTQRRL